jgi:hypothetical protein
MAALVTQMHHSVVICTLPVLLTCDICKILQGYFKVYLISVQFTNILLDFMTLQHAD